MTGAYSTGGYRDPRRTRGHGDTDGTGEHPGEEYLDMAFGLQEQRRLEYIDEGRRDPRSWWFGRDRGGTRTSANNHDSRNALTSTNARDEIQCIPTPETGNTSVKPQVRGPKSANKTRTAPETPKRRPGRPRLTPEQRNQAAHRRRELDRERKRRRRARRSGE